MPAPTLHITFADLIGDATDAPRAIREAVRSAPAATRLGAIYHDLPYYTGVVHLCITYWLERGDLANWGVRLHRDRPGAFTEHVVRTLRSADGPLDRTRRLAFLGGFLSHAIIDHTMHPLVNHLAEQQRLQHGGEFNHHHRLAEKFHSLFFHLDRFGDDILGSSIMRERMRLTDSARLDPAFARFMTDLMHGHFGDAPPPRQWARWVRCYRKVSWLLATYPAARNSRRVRTEEMRRRFYANEQMDFREFFAAAEKRTNRFLSFAYDYFEAADFSDKARARFIQEAALDDLAFPNHAQHPDQRVQALRKIA